MVSFQKNVLSKTPFFRKSADVRAKGMGTISGHMGGVQNNGAQVDHDFPPFSEALANVLNEKLQDPNIMRAVLKECSVEGREQNGFSRFDASPTDILRTLSKTPAKLIGVLCRAHLRSEAVFLDSKGVNLLIKVR